MERLPHPTIKVTLKRPAPEPIPEAHPKLRKLTLKLNGPASPSLSNAIPSVSIKAESEPPIKHTPTPITNGNDVTTIITNSSSDHHSISPLRAPSLPALKIKPPSGLGQSSHVEVSNTSHHSNAVIKTKLKHIKKEIPPATLLKQAVSPVGILTKPKIESISSSLMPTNNQQPKEESPPLLTSSNGSTESPLVSKTEHFDDEKKMKIDEQDVDIMSIHPEAGNISKPILSSLISVNGDDDYVSEDVPSDDDRISVVSAYDDEANELFAETITKDPNYQDMKILDTTSFIPKKAGLSASALASHIDAPEPDFLTSKFPSETDFRNLDLVHDHGSRPLIITPDGTVILEAYSSLAPQAKEFLTTIAEPSSRPARMHEYKLTSFSLYAAVSVGIETRAIIDTLERLCKTRVPENIYKFIKLCTQTYGKVRLVLKDTNYHIESAHPEILSMLLKDEIISNARVIPPAEITNGDATLSNNNLNKDIMNKKTINSIITMNSIAKRPIHGEETKKAFTSGIVVDDLFGAVISIDREDEESSDEEEDNEDEALLGGITQPTKKHVVDLTESFEIQKGMVEVVRRRCRELDYPLLEEYAYTEDHANPALDLTLKGTTAPRDYQAKALYKLLGAQNRARSGIIVLPTGAGKTLVGIAAATAIKKSVLVLCTNALSVEQWNTEFNRWANAPEGSIAQFTAQSKVVFKTPAGILITTYAMLSNQRERAASTLEVLKFINAREWGLVILDEVHVIPAKVFRKVLTIVAAHAKLGLTATLVREDDKIQDLNFLIGPKLYEADWLELMDAGHIARVECTEVWCPMPSAFYDWYMKSSHAKRRLLSVVHPGKFNVCQWLIRWRESLGDRILVFSDNIFALEMFAKVLNKPYLHGQVSFQERMGVIRSFKRGETQTLFLSKIGDTSLDIPEATCLIQINSQFGSRRQEAQRLGRILRAKRRNEAGFKARFYTLVSKDTDEVYWSNKRRTWLIDQGFEFNIINDIFQQIPSDQVAQLNFVTPEAQQNMLAKVLEATEDDAKDEVVAQMDDGFEPATNSGRKKIMTKTQRDKLQKQQQKQKEREEKKAAKVRLEKRNRALKSIMKR